MDAQEATVIVLSRIQKLDPENALKIMGLLLIRDHSDTEMTRLAFCSETHLHSVVVKTREELSLLLPSPTPFLLHPRRHSFPHSNTNTIPSSSLQLQEQLSFLNHPQLGPYATSQGANVHHRRSFSAADVGLGSRIGWEPCLYYAGGYCKNGTACMNLHGEKNMEAAVEQKCQELPMWQMGGAASFPYSPPTATATTTQPSAGERISFLSQQQQQNESQRRARIDLRKIYMTFPSDSTFGKEDVSNYFSSYGPVEDVRLPNNYHQKWMFGFVTFVNEETVKQVLAKRNPHFVCGARVLVKPYKEKGKDTDVKMKQQQAADIKQAMDAAAAAEDQLSSHGILHQATTLNLADKEESARR